MVKLISRIIGRSYKKNKCPSNEENSSGSVPATEVQGPKLDKSLAENLTQLKAKFGGSVDIVFREFNVGFDPDQLALLIYVEGLVEPLITNNSVLQPLMFELSPNLQQKAKTDSLLELIKTYALPNRLVRESGQVEEIVGRILSGYSALLLEGFDKALLIDTKGGKSRDIKEPDTEAVVRGPREGFTESITVNTSMLRRKIRNENLRIEELSIGTSTRTAIQLAYVRGIVKQNLVDEIKTRLQRIDIDGILESGYVEQLIEDAPVSVFPTIGNSEKPDVLAAKLLEGRVGILVDGTPFVLTVPHVFFEAFQNAEDYYTRPFFSTLVRWTRILSFYITILLPALYVSVQSFQPDLVPTALLLSMAGAREGVPFPAYMEVLIMGTIFEIMREAGIRMPRPIGQAVSIVGALVIGESAIRAGIISDPMVIVVALTAISGFVVAALADTLPLLRLFFTLCAAIFGLFGILIGGFVVFIHLAKLRSFGIPYTYPVVPGNLKGMKDVFIKAPAWWQKLRPGLLSGNSVRNRTPRPGPGGDNR